MQKINDFGDLERVFDFRCESCPAILASEAGKESLGWTACANFVGLTYVQEGEGGCSKGVIDNQRLVVRLESWHVVVE